MAMDEQQVTLGRIDYESAFRFTRIFESFRIAVHPTRLMLALLLIVLVYIGGRLMDMGWGPQVVPNEFSKYVAEDAEDFGEWRKMMASGVSREKMRGVFQAALQQKLKVFDAIVISSLSLDLGLHHLTPGTAPKADSVLGGLRMLLYLPAWMWQHHTWFLLAYLAMFVVLWSLLGGAISRQAIADAATARLTGPTEAFVFTFKRWGWYLLAPLLPLILIAVLGGLLALGGLVAFNVPGLDIVGGLLFVLALGAGFVITLLLILWVAGVHLMYPALSAEGTDAFDAMSRAYSYVMGRPWRLILYTLISLGYGAITYIFVGLFIFLTLYVTQWAVGLGVFTEATTGAGRFEAMLPPPQFGNLAEMPELTELSWPAKIAGVLVRIWVYLLIGLLAAYVISYYFAAFSQVYLLLRRYTDGTDPAELYEPEPAEADVQDKVEPAEEQGEGGEQG